MMHEATHDAVALHLSKLLNQHLLGHRGDRAQQLRKAPDVAAEQMKQDHELPTALEDS